jgi:hypothetical protein
MSAIPGSDPVPLSGDALGLAVERLRRGEDAVLVVDGDREVAAVLSIEEYQRFVSYRELEDELDGADVQRTLSDPNEEWASWGDVRDELLRGSSEGPR